MSSIEEYRRQLRQQVAVERAHSNEPRWSSRLESLGAEDVLGSPQGNMTDVDNLREAVVGARLNPDPAFRAEALGQIVSKSERSTAHQLPLEILSNPQETVQVRLAALRLLELLAISSPTFPEWRPAYLESLRIAIETSELRLSAFSALISQGDRRAQELLIRGLEDSEQALVSPADALNLLSEDPHADVRDLARQIVDQPPDERTLEAAIRHLAGDPSSVDRLRALVSDRQKTITARKLAAAALNALAPESLPVPDTQRSNNIRAESADVEAAEDPVEEFVRILASRRRRPS
ncbi:hypothetical protein COO91_08721 [Nostoc flagelliforme CCNUN1]|uniref:HEAT repeat domain-containing protein n=1 Tax=Nostoc flagelliforme CCNUN1 TaxID=2038116 RepID=A0A2K8T4I7_9NOSO|nr:hypothetical protein COO91_08721 [Nostoc flagelliforme CCNUN1]